MKKSVFVVMMSWAWLAATCVSSVAGRPEGGTINKHFQETLFALAEQGTVSIEVLFDDQEYQIGRDMIGIVVHDRQGKDFEGATLTVMMSGLSTPLAMEEKGGGLYVAPNDALPKKQDWELKVTVKKGAMEDTARFTLPDDLVKRLPAGKYDAEKLKAKR